MKILVVRPSVSLRVNLANLSVRLKWLLSVIVILLIGYPTGIGQEKTEKTEEIYHLTPELKVGQRFNVQQTMKWDGMAVIKTDDKSTEKQSFMNQIQHQYTEEIKEVDKTIKSIRSYNVSRKKVNSVGEGIKTEATSLEGKTLKLETVNNLTKLEETKEEPKDKTTEEKNIILEKDKVYLTALTECGIILPTVVKIGDEWKLGNDIAQVVFKENYDKDLCTAKGEARLEEIVEYRDTRCAKISFHATLKHSGTEATPVFQAEIDGLIYFALTNSMILSVELSGSCSGRYESNKLLDPFQKDEGEESREVAITGNLTYSFLCLPVNQAGPPEKLPAK